ncbi:hypothetical protein [Streptomyces sp. NPDC002394]
MARMPMPTVSGTLAYTEPARTMSPAHSVVFEDGEAVRQPHQCPERVAEDVASSPGRHGLAADAHRDPLCGDIPEVVDGDRGAGDDPGACGVVGNAVDQRDVPVGETGVEDLEREEHLRHSGLACAQVRGAFRSRPIRKMTPVSIRGVMQSATLKRLPLGEIMPSRTNPEPGP